MLIDKLVKDWAWRVNDGMPDPGKKDHLDLLETTLRANGMTEEFINKFIAEIDFKNKAEFAKYNAQHDMRSTTKVNIGGKDTTAGDADPKAKDTVKKKKPKAKPTDAKADEKLQKKIDKAKPGFIEKSKAKIDNIAFANEQDSKVFSEALPKLINGDDVSKEEMATLNKYARIKDNPNETTIYLANQKPGNFKQGARDKLKFGTGEAGKAVKQSMVDKGMEKADPVTSSESVPVKIGGKILTLSKMGKTISNKVEKTRVDGKITEVKVGDHTMRRQSMPDTDSLIKEIVEYKEQNPGISDEDVEHKVEQLQSGIIRYNNLIDSYDKIDNLDSVSLVEGANPATKEGRDKLAKEGPKVIANKLEEALGENPTKAEKQIVTDLENLSNIDDPSEYEKESMEILKRMGNAASISKAAPDLAESLVLLANNKNGKPTIAPAGETFPVADLIQFPIEDLDPNDPDYIKKIAAGGETIVTMTDAGGLSVKKDGGAASGFTAKLGMTTFKTETTKESLTNVLNQHNNFIGGKSKGAELSEEKIQSGKAVLDKEEKAARKAGLIKGDLKFKDGRTPRQWAEDNLAKWEADGKYKGMTDENKKMLLDGMEQYSRGGLILQEVHNNDLAFQDYANANANTKTGEIEMSDGINCINNMAFQASPGFEPAQDKNGNWVARPNAVYAGNLKKVCR